MIEDQRPLAVVTGASSGIGYELARLAAEDGYDLVIAADDPSIVEAQTGLEQRGPRVEALQVDLSTTGDAAGRAGRTASQDGRVRHGERPMSDPRPHEAEPRPAGQEAPPHPALDPTRKTEHTSDPTADDPGNGAD